MTWRKREIMEMAREAGIDEWWNSGSEWRETFDAHIERFAALVREDEAERYKWDVHSCGPTCERYACVAMREAVLAEREACAKLLEEAAKAAKNADPQGFVWQAVKASAEVIRARGQA